MQEYPVKRGFTKDLDTRVVAELKNCFGVEPRKTAKGYRMSPVRLNVSMYLSHGWQIGDY